MKALKILGLFVGGFILILLILFVFRDFFALRYANFFYKEEIPSGFDIDGFNSFKKEVESGKFSKASTPLLLKDSAIINLGGWVETRIFQSIALYFYNVAPKVLITSPRSYIENDFGGSIQSELKQMTLALKYAKVDFETIPSLNGIGAQSTLDEALDVAAYLKQKPLDSIVLVTSEFHSKRAYDIFSRVFREQGIKTKIYSIPSINKYFNRTNWHRSEAGLIAYTLELPKMVMYYLHIGKIKGVEAY